jgi:hypothetical protein
MQNLYYGSSRLKIDWNTFRGGMKRKMDNFMDVNRDLSNPALERLQSDFLRTLNVVTSVFRDHAFHRWMPERRTWRQHVLAALYDAQMFSCQNFSAEELTPHKTEIVDKFQDLFSDDDFRRSIDAATNTPTYFKDRITRLHDLLRGVLTL